MVYLKSFTHSAYQLLISTQVLIVSNNLVYAKELYLQDMAPKKQKGSSAEQELSDSVPTIQKSQKHNPKLKIF